MGSTIQGYPQQGKYRDFHFGNKTLRYFERVVPNTEMLPLTKSNELDMFTPVQKVLYDLDELIGDRITKTRLGRTAEIRHLAKGSTGEYNALRVNSDGTFIRETNGDVAIIRGRISQIAEKGVIKGSILDKTLKKAKYILKTLK